VYRNIISIVKPIRCTSVSNLFSLERCCTCFGQSFHPSSGVLDCTYSNRHLSNRYCCLLANGYLLASRYQLASREQYLFDSCKCNLELLMTDGKTVQNECHSKINKFDTLVHLVGFTIGRDYGVKALVEKKI